MVSNLEAQSDSAQSLKEINVISTKRSQQIVGTRIDVIDTLTLNLMNGLSLAEVLAQQSGLFIKNYGPGNLASSSLRGGSSSQTQLYWGNLNIQNPMLGQNDFSLFPAFFFENVELAYGGIGGLYLNNTPRFNDGLRTKLALQAGSFGMKQVALGLNWSRERSVTSVKAYTRSARNDFSYLNTFLDVPERVKLTHSDQQQQGLLVEHTQLLGAYRLSLKAWLQTADRDLPPTMAQQSSEAIQKDDSQRLMAELSRSKRRYSWMASAGVFRDRIYYKDEITTSDSRSLSAVQQLEVRKWWGDAQRFSIRTKLNSTYTTASTANYGNTDPQQQRTLLQLSGEYRSSDNRLFSQIGLRQELIAGRNIPLCPVAGFEWNPVSWYALFGNISRIYRVPTFNDQFWVPGGNPDLLPEQGYSGELGLTVFRNTGRFRLEETTTGFNKHLKNWIIWLPGNTYWSPQNLMEVWSRGIETKWTATYTRNDLVIKANTLTNYVISTNQKARLEGDDAVGRQLIYTPLYTGQGTLSLAYKGFAVAYNHTYTGYTYTTSDNLNYLEPYQLGNLYLNKKLRFRNYGIDLGFSCLNLWNRDYQTVVIRPMPGRNYLLSASFSFHKS